MVDGTLVPLFMRPGFFGNTWFDRKSNYSLNVQVSCIIFHLYYYYNISNVICVISLSQLQIYVLSTTVLVYQEASMMPQHGQRHVFHRSIRDYLAMMNGYGVTLHIPYKNGVSHLIKSMLLNCICTIMLILINLTGLRKTQEKTQSTTIMCPRFEFAQSIVLDS